MALQLLTPWIFLVISLATFSTNSPVLNHEQMTIPPSSISPIAIPSLLDAATPTCFAVEGKLDIPTNSTTTLTSFPSDCIAAMKSFLNWPTVSRTQYHWKRMPPYCIPPPGYGPLPFVIGEFSCVLELDVLQDSGAEDQFALYQLKDSVLRLFRKCVRGEQRSGFIAVGPKKVIGLTMKPKAKGGSNMLGLGGASNETGWMDVR